MTGRYNAAVSGQSRGPGPYAGIAAADAAGSSAGHAL
jgi:hypothetical protein